MVIFNRVQLERGSSLFRVNWESEGHSHAPDTWLSLQSNARTRFRTNSPSVGLQRGPSAPEVVRPPLRGSPARPGRPPDAVIPQRGTRRPAPPLRGGPRVGLRTGLITGLSRAPRGGPCTPKPTHGISASRMLRRGPSHNSLT